MRVILLAALALTFGPSFAQQTPADAFSRGFMQGKQIRQAAEERKALAAQRRHRQLAAELEAAYNSPFVVLKSRNGLPDIVLSNRDVSVCKNGSGIAFTRDARGDLVYGCATASEAELSVLWESYGLKTYSLTEWEEVQPSSPDEAPLGAP